jgi:RHS repeat-associated protein
MKLFSRGVFLTLLLCDLTRATAQEFRFSGNLMTRETWTGSVKGSVSYTYDNELDITSRRVNARAPIAFSYDADKLLTGVGDLTIARNPQNGLIIGAAIGSISESWSYNEFAEPTNYRALFGATLLYALQFTRDALGRAITRTETIGGVASAYTYTYDAADRLTVVTMNGALKAAYTYDGNDNRLNVADDSGPRNGAYDNQDRLLSMGPATYTWTPNGELATRDTGGQVYRYTYDVFGSLLRVSLPNGTLIEYLVDGRNRRVGKKVNGTLAQAFLYQGLLRPAAELDGAGNVISEFVYGTRENVPEYLIKGGQTYRIICDHLGSSRLVVNVADGQIAQRMDYDAFGRVLADTAPGFQPFGFAGGLYDHDTGLVRFGARDYQAETGRWTAKDPILFSGGQPNLYAYVHNDPVNWIDPTGLQSSGGQCGPAGPPKKKQPSPEDWKTVMRELKKISKRHEQERKDENDLKDLEIQR